jgi:hypothetical protein
MGITVQIETEQCERVGETVTDDKNLLHRLLPDRSDSSYQCLRFIDWYGDTMFNRLQMAQLLKELDNLLRIDISPEGKQLLEQIAVMARKCGHGTHLYLKFYGD